MKIAVSTDSGSGITQEEGRRLRVSVVPMPFRINGKDYYEDISLRQAEFYELLKGNCEMTTSQPAPEMIMKLWDALLLENDAVVHVPLTSGLSGSCQTALMLSQEDRYAGRVFIANSRGVSVTQRHHCIEAVALADRGYAPDRICSILERDADRNSIYIALDTLKYLERGGRITPMAAAVGTFLKIKPILTIVNGGKLDAFAKVRTQKLVRETIANALRHDLENKLQDPEARNCGLAVAYTDNPELGSRVAEELAEMFPARGIKEVTVEPLSLLISCHIGPGAIGAAVYETVPELRNA